jgi:membrane-associated phospholipid phosphatase
VDWLPLAAIVGAYWLGGYVSRVLARPPTDDVLLAWELRLFSTIPGIWLQHHLNRPALTVLEFFYFSYYIFVPLAPLLLYARNGRRALWSLWISGGVSYLICDLISPWFPSTPPRLLWPDFAMGSGAQAMNQFVLRRFSIGANVFPSSHVAGTLAFALCHWHYGRRWFLPWALGIAMATVTGGYHYGVDAVAGLGAGLAGGLLGWALFAVRRDDARRF